MVVAVAVVMAVDARVCVCVCVCVRRRGGGHHVPVGGRLEVRGGGRDELRAAVGKELLERGVVALAHPDHLLAAIAEQLGVDALIDALRAERHDDCQQVEELLLLLVDHAVAAMRAALA